MQDTGFSDRLLKLIKKKKISQTRVASELGLSRTAVNKWTKGGMIDDTNLERLAEFLDVDMIWLKYGQQENNTPVFSASHEGINEVHLQDSAEIVFWEWDLLTDRVVYSDNVERVYGIRIDSNQDYWQLMGEQAREKLNAGYQKIIQEGGAHEMDFALQVGGQRRWITSRAAGVTGENGKITRLVGISIDNTERKLAELALKRDRGFLKLLLSRMSSLVLFTDQAGEIIETNLADSHQAFSFLELQSLIYKAVMQYPDLFGETAQQPAMLSFEGIEMTIHRHMHDDGKSYLMLEID
ncbi:helix-turn-helix transcriptional regulator [Neptunomonas sp. XY-337]|uniref:helix-turn-helix domain-containing protein n=1 Tax=Neptunomonas sp. XY-337 TaxID=2561897 RepID=UPI0010AA77D0|nr:helix-turn-helix transcriptional regulator [Neptunomonas sp. XY-337]